MILIDSRTGSKDLYPLVRSIGVEAELAHLDAGDACFMGNGETGTLTIGLERKSIASGDFITSIRSKRLAGFQLPKLLESMDRVYLIVEGRWRSGDNGTLEIGHVAKNPHDPKFELITWVEQKPMAVHREVDNFITAIEEELDVGIRRTTDARETARVLVNILSWWSKPWSEHKTADTMYIPQLHTVRQGRRVVLRVPQPVWAWSSLIRGVGKRADAIADRFHTPLEMCQATEKEWLEINGVGKILARRAVAACQQGRWV